VLSGTGALFEQNPPGNIFERLRKKAAGAYTPDSMLALLVEITNTRLIMGGGGGGGGGGGRRYAPLHLSSERAHIDDA